MTRADIERLSGEYRATEPLHGRLARALRVEVPVWRELGNEILADLDEGVFGVGWWSPGPGTSRRILISDHLLSCVRSIETNLVEAQLHLLEAMDFWEREADFYARSVSINRGRRLELRPPERRRPLEDLLGPTSTLHVVGFIRAIAGALDCFGASVVGVAALKTRLLQADLAKARQALAKVGGTTDGERTQVAFRERLEGAIEQAGPTGWLSWTIDLRNMLIHRGRRLQPIELRPIPSGILQADGSPVVRTDVFHLLPRDPGRSEVEMFLDTDRAPVLTESAAVTLRSVLESTLRLLDEGGRLSLELWRQRRQTPTLLTQPRRQWPDGPSGATTGFPGYAPESIPYAPDHIRADPELLPRLRAASLGDAAVDAWANFD